MPCPIRIKENLQNNVKAAIPNDFYNYNDKNARLKELEINNHYGYPVVKFLKDSSGNYDHYIIDIPQKLVNEFYALEEKLEIEDRRRLDEEANQKFNDEGDVYYQEESKDKQSKELNDKIKTFLTSIGVTTINVDALYDSQGNKLNATAVADMLNKVIKVVNNKAGLNTLPEEASHFFVEMIEGTPMLDNMLNKIVNYPEYQQVINSEFYQNQYKGDERKLKKEAIGKVITSYIINNNENISEENSKFLDKWWNILWNKIKNLFNRATNNPFEESAKSILNNKINEDFKSKEGLYYQEDNKQNDIINNLDNKFNISYNEDLINEKTNKKGVYELSTKEGLKKIYNRVSDRVEKYMSKKNFAERTAKEKIDDEVRREHGVKGHADIQNIITRLIESYNGVNNTQRVNKLSEGFYNSLENYFKELLASYPAGTKFYTEKVIYDELTNEAGTIDFLAVLPDGKIDILDWKFVEFKQKDSDGKIISKSVPWYKEEAYNIQLTRYRNILKNNYGVTQFGKTRVIPISVTYNKTNLVGLEIGNKKLDGQDKSYLDPVPIRGVAGGEVELTGDEKIDNLIKVLIQKRDSLTNKTEVTSEGKLKKSERLERINDAIKSLQVQGDVKLFLEDAVFELKYITNIGIENLSLDDLTKAKELVDYYSDLKKNDIIDFNDAKKYETLFNKVTSNSQELYSRVMKEYEKRVKEIALNKGVTNIEELQKETGMMSRLFRTISQSNHPIIKTFYKLVTEAKDKVYKDTESLNKEIEHKLSNLKEWGSSRGYKGTDIFKDILQFKDGKWTGNLIAKWDSKYFTDKDTAIKNKDSKWFVENTIFNKEKYDETLKRNIDIWTKMYSGEEDGQSKINKRITDFSSKYNVLANNTAYYNKSNYFISPIEKWKSKELLNLERPENKPLKEFYDLFTQTINSFRDFLPLDTNGNFIPNIKNDLLDQISQNGFSSINGIGNSIIQHLDAKSDETIGMIDEITGERIKQIPLLYTSNIDSESKSKDLGKVLSIFANMAYNYKHMSEIESASIILRDTLANRKQLLTTVNGNEAISKITGKVAEVMGSSDTLEQFNDYMNYYLYGIQTKNKDVTYKAFGKELSGIKTFSKAMSYFSTKSLAGNLVSGTANALGGVSNAFFEGVKGRFYTNSEYRKSLSLLSTADKKAYSLISYFDIDSSETTFKKANKLSVSNVSKNLTMDKFYILQRGGDYVVENSVLLSMLQSHTLKDGKIVKKQKDDKSLLDLAKIENDSVNIPGLTEEEFFNFRRKVKYLYGTMKGNTNNDDINNIKLTVLGQGLMQFRNWIPRMADERFGDLRYTEDLNVWEEGKYKTFWGQTVNKKIIPNIINTLVNGGVLGIGAGMNSKFIELKAKELYIKERAKNPDIKITESEFIELHKANMKSAALELQLILTLIGMLALLKPDGDDDKDSLRTAALKIINRNLDEVSFFINPSSTTSILKKPVPILGLATDITSFVSDFTGEGVGYIINDQKMIDKNKPLRKFNKIFPVTNALESFWSLTDPDYNKSERSKKKGN